MNTATRNAQSNWRTFMHQLHWHHTAGVRLPDSITLQTFR